MLSIPRSAVRRGGVTVEAAITIPVFLTLVLGMIDLSIAVARYNTLSQASRHGARQAVVHGKLAPAGWNGGPWGTVTVDQQADTNAWPANAIGPMMANCPLDDSNIRVEWPDGNNEPGSRVRVTVTSNYQPMITYIFGSDPIALSSSSTMLISH